MKISTVIYGVVLIVLTIFTVLYFVKPREITVTIPSSVVDHIPDEVSIAFTPSVPDTTWKIKVTQLRKHIEKLETKLGYSLISDKEFETYPEELIVSKKLFREVLLGTDERPLFNVESNILAYAEAPVKFFESTVSIAPNKENLIKEYLSTLTLPKRSSKFWTGVGIGMGTATGIFLVGHLTGAF